MPLVTRASVGGPAFARLIRDRIVLPYGPAVGRPTDVPDSAGLRAWGASRVVPRDDVLTACGALWVRGWTSTAPVEWHTATARSSRDRRRPGVARHGCVTLHHGERVGPLLVATPARACIDALQWEPLDTSLPIVAGGLLAGRVSPEALRVAASLDRRPSPARTRARNALATLLEATATEAACRP